MEYCFKYHIPEWTSKADAATLSGTYDIKSMMQDFVEAFSEMALTHNDPHWKSAVEWCVNVPNNTQVFVDAVLSAVIFRHNGFPLPTHALVGMQKTPGEEEREYPKDVAAYTMFEAYSDLIESRENTCGIFYNEKCVDDMGGICYRTTYSRYSGSPLCILHELGHWLNYLVSGDRSHGDYQTQAAKVSYYSMQNYAEFMAESLSSMMMGRSLDNDVVSKVDTPEDGINEKLIRQYQLLLSNGSKAVSKTIAGVTPKALAKYNYTELQRKNPVFVKHFDYLRENAYLYGINMDITYCIDLFCNIMNEDFTVVYHAPSAPYREPQPLFRKGEFVYVESKDMMAKAGECFQIADTLYYELENMHICQKNISKSVNPKYDIDFVNRMWNVPMKFNDVDLIDGEFVYRFGSRGKFKEKDIANILNADGIMQKYEINKL